MKQPISLCLLTESEIETLHSYLRSSDTSVARRCQILLASSQGESVSQIAERLGCTGQTVRNVIHVFNKHGLEALYPKSSRPQTTHEAFSPKQQSALLALLSQGPRSFGKRKATGRWTYKLLAEVCFEQGITPRKVTGETIRVTLLRMNIDWDMARLGISTKKGRETRQYWTEEFFTEEMLEQRYVEDEVARQLRSRWNSS
jgi:transposase